MPVHDWTRVDPGIVHDFHHDWITEIKRALNRGILPSGYYALAEQHAAGFGPDVLIDMPLFLEPEKAVDVPLEATYNAAFAEVPRRWRRVLESSRVTP